MASNQLHYQHVSNTFRKATGLSKTAFASKWKVVDGLLLFDDFDEEIFIGDLDGFNLTELLTPSKFEKSKVFEQYSEGESLSTGEYRMIIHIKGTYLIMYNTFGGYDGVGGIVIKSPTGGSFVIEPIKNYMLRYESAEGEE